MNGCSSVRVAVFGGMAGAAVALGMTVLGVAVVVRMASRRIPRMMGAMMSEGGCAEQMRACMEYCGCLGAATKAADETQAE